MKKNKSSNITKNSKNSRTMKIAIKNISHNKLKKNN